MPENPGNVHTKCTFNRTRLQWRCQAESTFRAGLQGKERGNNLWRWFYEF
jgi:hypothetical protein